MALRGAVLVLVLAWPASAWCQTQAQALLDTVRDDESLLAASRPLLELAERNRSATLRVALDSKSPHVRWIAAMALVWNGRDPSSPELAVPILVDAIKHGSPEIRKLAFSKLGDLSFYSGYRDICAPVVDGGVIAGLRDPVDQIHYGALRALSECPHLPVSIAAREIAQGAEGYGRHRDFRLFLISNLSRRGPEAQEATDTLIAALDDDDGEVRDAAAKALRAAAVDPALYVPRIIDEVHGTEPRRQGGALPIDKLYAVAPDAAPWASEIVDMHQNAPSPYVRGQLGRVLKRIGTPEARRVAERDEAKASLARLAPMMAMIAATIAVLGLLVVTGWGVLLGFVFPAVPLTAGLVFANDAWQWLPVIVASPPCSLVGAVAGFLFASGESGGKRALGLFAGGVSAVALLVYGFGVVALYYGLAPLGAG